MSTRPLEGGAHSYYNGARLSSVTARSRAGFCAPHEVALLEGSQPTAASTRRARCVWHAYSSYTPPAEAPAQFDERPQVKIEAKLASMGITLTSPTMPATAPLRSWVISGNHVYLSGTGPRPAGGAMPTGKLGRDFTTEQGKAMARQVGINLLGALKDAVGDLDRVVRVVKLLGMVNCTEDYTDQPQVVNGCSELFVELWGEEGRHARSAVGMQQLPGNMPVEIEAIFEIK